MGPLESIALIFLIVLIITVVINVIIAMKFEEIVYLKGYKESKGAFFMCLFLGIIGALYVIALPDQRVIQVANVNETMHINKENADAETTGSDNVNIRNERYACRGILVAERLSDGYCKMCKQHSPVLNTCKIMTEIGTRNLPVCPKCIEKFRANSEQ